MPDEVIWADRFRGGKPAAAWVEAMTPLFVAPMDKDPLPIRSTEFLYRCWDRGEGVFYNPMAHSEAGRAAQATFRAEFLTILDDIGSVSQRVARGMMESGVFIQL